MSIYLPEEVVINILQRVPVKALLRCRSVCKTWYTLISSSHFISTHLNFNKNNTPYLLFGYWQKCRSLNILKYALYFDIQTFDLHTQFEFPFESVYGYLYVQDSFNGLICLIGNSTYNHLDRIILWNPMINKALYVPQPIHICDLYDNSCMPSFAFGFDSATKDHKVLRILWFTLNRKVPKVELYRLNAEIWEDLSHLELPYTFGADGVNVNGAAHWIGQEKRGKLVIVMFDMHSEVFRDIALPSSLADQDLLLSSSLYDCQGLLCLIHCYKDQGDWKFDIWLMKEYGVVESWSKQSTVNVNVDLNDDIDINSLWRPRGFRNNGEILLPTNKGGLISYDTQNKIITNTDIGDLGRLKPYYLFSRTYVESLVLLDKKVDCDTGVLLSTEENHDEPAKRKRRLIKLKAMFSWKCKSKGKNVQE